MRRFRSALVALLVLLALGGIVGLPALAPAVAGPADSLDPPSVPRRATGYWFVGGDGGIFSFGSAGFQGSTGGLRLAAPVTAMAATPSGRGYWLAATDGGIFAFGDAAFAGSMGGRPLNRPIVGMAATPTGRGYWLVASDGGIFAFGDAAFFGSTGAIALNKPIVAMTPTPTGRGYWLVASDGGIFAFGDAAFLGSTGSLALKAPVVSMERTSTGGGYWLVASDGGIFAFGDAPFLGSTGAMVLNRPIVGMAQTGFSTGYWLVAEDGGVFSFGDAIFHGSSGDLQLSSPIVAMAAAPRQERVRTAAFYYPWYGDADAQGRWRHWDDPNPDTADAAFAPPDLVASDFYPAAGAYDSADAATAERHMGDLTAAGVDTAVVSWWGRGSYEDARLPSVMAAAQGTGRTVAVHLEPYPNRTPETVALDVAHLRGLGIREVWIYLADGPAPEAWRTVTDSFGDVFFWAHSHRAANATSDLFPAYAAKAGFDGVYTYDPLPYSPDSFARVCQRARARGLACSPSVNPGYDDRTIRPTGGQERGREGGARYDSFWRGAFRAGPEVISITSYNEWHEGTQIEPATPRCVPGARCYADYGGAYGTVATAANRAYLDRTRAWTDALRAATG